jgi:hypothetical protein
MAKRLLKMALPVFTGLMLWMGAGEGNRLWADDETSVPGTYRDEQVILQLNRPPGAGAGTDYVGVIQLGEEKFPLRVQIVEGRVTGTFESQGEAFPLSGSIVGRMLVFTTGGTTYRLKKQTTNPLAQPSRPNPLAVTRTNLSRPAPAIPATNLAVAAPTLTRHAALHFRRYSIMDDLGVIGGEAFSLLIPVDWQVEGGLVWRMHPSVPAYTALRVSNSNATQVLEALPAIPFVWTDGGIPFFPAGSIYMGNEVGEPITDPLTYVRQVILPRFRQSVKNPQFVGTEELPKIVEILSEGAPEPGVEKKFRAARIRIEYPENGRTMQEDIYCVLAAVRVGGIQTTFWGADRNYSFKAEKGRLESSNKIFQAMADSFRPNLQWFNRYLQLLQRLAQAPPDATRRVTDLGRFIAGTTDEITDARRQVYDRQQAAQEKINTGFDQYVRGTEPYQSPFENRPVHLPAGYTQVWANSLGEYLLSEDPGFNPNANSPLAWQKLDRLR